MIAEQRRSEIVWLLTHRNDHFPSRLGGLSAEAQSQRGFVHHTIVRETCPDCLADDHEGMGYWRTRCETCGGSGFIESKRERDPYAKNDVVGVDLQKHEATHERDRQIAMLDRQTRPPRKEAELLEEANRRGYAWEEARRTMYRLHDFALIDQALDALRIHDQDAAHAINAVYVDGWLAEVGLITPLAEQLCERGLSWLSDLLPETLRTGLAPAHPAAERQTRRRAA